MRQVHAGEVIARLQPRWQEKAHDPAGDIARPYHAEANFELARFRRHARAMSPHGAGAGAAGRGKAWAEWLVAEDRVQPVPQARAAAQVHLAQIDLRALPRPIASMIRCCVRRKAGGMRARRSWLLAAERGVLLAALNAAATARGRDLRRMASGHARPAQRRSGSCASATGRRCRAHALSHQMRQAGITYQAARDRIARRQQRIDNRVVRAPRAGQLWHRPSSSDQLSVGMRLQGDDPLVISSETSSSCALNYRNWCTRSGQRGEP